MKRILFLLCAVALVFNSNAQEVSATYDPDVDGDNNIGVTDLLALLSLFSENDLDDDGIWDSQDDCVGEYDECGVCNGEGIPEGYCTCSLMIDALGECGGDCANDFDGDGICDEYFGPCFGLQTVTFNAYTYDLVAIGNQCWFAENLRTEHYANGDTIPSNLSDDEWTYTTSGATAIYEGSASNLEAYGLLYNWMAVDDPRGLCPSGWHVPSDGEWITMEMALGMSESEANGIGWRGNDQGTQMKASPEDTPGWNGTNSSGFSALPGGADVGVANEYYSADNDGFWWSSSSDSNGYPWRRLLNDVSTNVQRGSVFWGHGYSVRCIKDE